ncbi:hypothetical protein CK203_060821 [Vitis vinifera]|uniref:Retrotransposon gag domain-containing protein n=1 Tax=Vitis vinifera TaxID=29760 RepID=A0A438GAG7_VITVI|nr:hypothetical protein CK203_060821 [Vitis vinifera]
MEAINACPHRGFDTWLLVSYFYDGMSSSLKQLLETMCGGDFMSKNLEEAMDFLNYMAEFSRGWAEPNAREVGRMKSQPNAKDGMYVLNEDINMKAKVAAMARRLEELEMKKHLVEECPTIPAVREMFGDQANPPQYTQPAQAPQQASNLEQAIVNLSKIDNVQYSIARLTNLNTVQKKGKFPSQPHQNPKGIHEVEAQGRILSKVREVKVVITLRSVKYKDPGCPTISVSIGGTCVEKTLLDLGTSVNLLPYSVYKQLGLGKLKPTSITLSLEDRLVKIARGMIEDVLVQVDKFYYPMDFVVLDTDPIVKETNYVPIILGRPFLATSNAIINCRNGVMQLTFGNMTLELNIFHLYKKHIHPEEEESSRKFAYYLAPMERREEILPLFNEEETQRHVKEEFPKLILKPLPTELKYAYLEEDKQCPIVISSTLTTHQEDCLLEVPRRCKKAIG